MYWSIIITHVCVCVCVCVCLCVCVCVVFQIGAANPRLQKVLDALDAIKTKVRSKVTILSVTSNPPSSRLPGVAMTSFSHFLLHPLLLDTRRGSRPPFLTLTQRLFSPVLWIIGRMTALWPRLRCMRVSPGSSSRSQSVSALHRYWTMLHIRHPWPLTSHRIRNISPQNRDSFRLVVYVVRS